MLAVKDALTILNNKGYKVPPFITKWRQTYYGMSLHITGACPSFKSLAAGKTRRQKSNQFGGIVYPPGYCGLEYDNIFTTYLLNQHPREPDEIFNWRLSQYRPYTRTPFRRIIDVVKGAIFQDANYTINIEDKADYDYLFGNNFNGKDIIGYIKSNIEWIMEDPNGVFITIPVKPYYEMVSPKVEVDIFFVPSKNIIVLNDDEIIFVIKDMAWLVNNNAYFRFNKGENGEYLHIDGVNGGYYCHDLGHLPAIVGGGNWNTQGWFDSWLNAAKAIADDYVSVKSDFQLINKEAVHPIIVEAATDCPACEAGYVMQAGAVDPDESNPNGFGRVRCDSCGGSGSMSHNPGQRIVAPIDKMEHKLVQIIGFDMKPNEFLSKELANIYDSMVEALHMNYIDDAQSGIAKDKDMETRYQFIQNISDDIFDRILTGLIKNILSIRNVTVSVDGMVSPAPSYFEIIKPTQFQIKTAGQLLEDFKASTDSKMPDYVKSKCLEDYVDKQFGGSGIMRRKVNVISQMDILAAASETDKQTRMMGGAVTNRDWQFSVWLPNILDTIIRNKGTEWFIEAPYEEIKSEVDPLFALVPEIKEIPSLITGGVKPEEPPVPPEK